MTITDSKSRRHFSEQQALQRLGAAQPPARLMLLGLLLSTTGLAFAAGTVLAQQGHLSLIAVILICCGMASYVRGRALRDWCALNTQALLKRG